MYIRDDMKADGVGKERAQEAIHWEVTSKSHLCEDNDGGIMAENGPARESKMGEARSLSSVQPKISNKQAAGHCTHFAFLGKLSLRYDIKYVNLQCIT